jgi:hypothetical protein
VQKNHNSAFPYFEVIALYPARMESGGEYCFGVVPPPEFRLRARSLQPLGGIQ